MRLKLVDGAGQTVDAAIDGHVGKFLFDSGWGVTAVTPAIAAAIGCTPWGQLTGFRTVGERIDFPHCDRATLRVGQTELSVPTLGVVDLMRYMPGSPVTYAGAIGLDAFAGQRLTICLHAGALVIETPASFQARVALAQEVPVRIAGLSHLPDDGFGEVVGPS